jgi:hypothetical protein
VIKPKCSGLRSESSVRTWAWHRTKPCPIVHNLKNKTAEPESSAVFV